MERFGWVCAFTKLPRDLAWIVLHLWMMIEVGHMEIVRTISDLYSYTNCRVKVTVLVTSDYMLFATDRPDNSVYIDNRTRWPKIHDHTWTPFNWLVSIFGTRPKPIHMDNLEVESLQDLRDLETTLNQCVDSLKSRNTRVYETFKAWYMANKVY